jgi:hypothetical protein
MADAAFGPSGGHCHFLLYNVEAVTLSPNRHPDGNRVVRHDVDHSTMWLGQEIENFIRVNSNLSEKLHQSYWM